jgi:TRAP-type C4-dicarboxylate transport system substrate-binding protein
MRIGRWRKAVVGGLMVLALILAITLVPTSAPKSAAPAIKLRVATWEGTEGSAIIGFLKGWGEEIQKRTKGRVTLEVAYGGVMAPAPEHYDLAVKGLADISHVGLPYTPGRFPMAEVIEMPIGRASEATYSKALWELYKKGYFNKDFKDVKILYLAAVGPYDYQMGKKPVRTLADVKDLKIRASGKVHTNIVKALGSVPVGLPGPEVYSALDKGVIDGAFAPWSFMKTFRTDPVTKYVTEIGVGGFGHAFVMSKTSYAKLPPDIKKIADEICEKGAMVAGETFAAMAEEARKVLFKGEIIPFPAADVPKVDAALAPIWQKWIAEGEAKGLPRKKMVGDLFNILKGLGVAKPLYGYTP